MNKIKLNPYSNLTNEELIDFTIEEVNQLIIEVKRRNISLNRQNLSRRILL